MASFELARAIIQRKLHKKPFQDAYLLGVIQKAVGDSGQVVSVKNRIAKVRVSDQITGYQLMARQQDIVKKITQKTGEAAILELKVVVEYK